MRTIPRRSSARCCIRATTQVDTPEAAHYVFYNTCSIRDKAEQKVFNRLQQFKRDAGKGKVFAVIGCVAQQEGEKIFERAPHVSLVAGSASYTKLPRDAGATRSRQPARHRARASTPTRLSIRPSRAATIRTAPTSRSSKAATKAAPTAWSRSRADRSAAAPARASWKRRKRLADAGYTEIQLLGPERQQLSRSFARRLGFRHAARSRRHSSRHPARALHHLASARLRQADHRRHRSNPNLCNHVHLPVQSGSTRVLEAMQRLYTRDQYMDRIEWMKNARRADRDHDRHHRRLSRRNRKGFRRDARAARRSAVRFAVQLQIFAAAEHRGAGAGRSHPGRREDAPHLIVKERQRAIQIRRNSELDRREWKKCTWKGATRRSGQWIGRTSHNRTLNFTARWPASDGR